jgi:hypothetical protein
MKVILANPGTDVRSANPEEGTLRAVCAASTCGRRGATDDGSGGGTLARTVDGAGRAERVRPIRAVMAARTVILALAAVTIVTAAVSVVLPA